MAYRRELWCVSIVSDVRIMWNITACTLFLCTPPSLLKVQPDSTSGISGNTMELPEWSSQTEAFSLLPDSCVSYINS
jgi:hypothetical protein